MTPLGSDVNIGGEIDVLDGGGGDGQGGVGLRASRGVWHDIPVGDGGGEADVGEGYVEKDVVAVVEEELLENVEALGDPLAHLGVFVGELGVEGADGVVDGDVDDGAGAGYEVERMVGGGDGCGRGGDADGEFVEPLAGVYGGGEGGRLGDGGQQRGAAGDGGGIEGVAVGP